MDSRLTLRIVSIDRLAPLFSRCCSSSLAERPFELCRVLVILPTSTSCANVLVSVALAVAYCCRVAVIHRPLHFSLSAKIPGYLGLGRLASIAATSLRTISFITVTESSYSNFEHLLKFFTSLARYSHADPVQSAFRCTLVFVRAAMVLPVACTH